MKSVLTITLLVALFFWKFFILAKIPLPADFVLGVYPPWNQYNWGEGSIVKNPIMADVVSFSYPMKMLAQESMKNGIWPLWNPYILTGTPLLANFQSAPFAPTMIFYWLTNINTAWGLQIVSQHLIAALAMYALVKNWKVSNTAAIASSTIYAFSGFSIIWSQWNAHTLVAAYIPLLFLFQEKWFEKSKIIYLLLFSVTLCLQIFSGYPQVVIYTLLALGTTTLFEIGTKKNLYKSLALLVAVILGFCLSAIQLAPSYELLTLSQREIEPHPYEWAFLPYTKIITFAASDYYGNHATNNYWGPQDYTSNTGYVGVAALALSSLAIISKNKKNKKIIATLLLGLLLSFPTLISTALWENGILGFQAASAHRALVLWTFSISCLAGLGIDCLAKTKEKRKIVYSLIPVSAVLFYFLAKAVSLASGNTRYISNTPIYEVAILNLLTPLIVLILVATSMLFKKKTPIVILIVFELFTFGWKFTPFSNSKDIFPETKILSFLKNTDKQIRTTGEIPVNMRMPYKIETFEGYDAVYPSKIAKLLGVVNSSNKNAPAQGRYGILDNKYSDAISILGITHVIEKKSKQYSSEKLEKVFDGENLVVYKNSKSLPRVYITNNYKHLSDDDILSSFAQNPTEMLETTYISKNLPTASGNSKGEVVVNEQKVNSLSFGAKATDDAIAVILDSSYPGWNAYVDGVKIEIFTANYLFKAIEIKKGEHEIKVVYEPNSFKIGKTISQLSALLVLFIFISEKLYLRKSNA